MKYTIPFLVFTLIFTSCYSNAKTNRNGSILNEKIIQRQASNFIKQKITENIYVLKAKNYRTNIGVFIGEENIILVDPMSGTGNHQALLDEIRDSFCKANQICN